MDNSLNHRTGIRQVGTALAIRWATLSVAALGAISVVGCGPAGRPNVVGKWYDSSRALKVEFFKDGTVNFTSLAGDDRNPDVYGGQYALIDNKHIRLESSLLGPMTGPIACEIQFSGRRADTLTVRLGADRELLLNRLTAQQDSDIVGVAGLTMAMCNTQVVIEAHRSPDGCYPIHSLDSLVAFGLHRIRNPYTGANYELNKDLVFLPNALSAPELASDSLITGSRKHWTVGHAAAYLTCLSIK